jgi:hypothetical protein
MARLVKSSARLTLNKLRRNEIGRFSQWHSVKNVEKCDLYGFCEVRLYKINKLGATLRAAAQGSYS